MTVNQATWLEINNVDCATPAWLITDLSELLNDAPMHGGDRVIPRMEGALPYRRRRGVWRVTLPWAIFGDTNEDGSDISDPRQGLIDHMDYLRSNLGVAKSTGDGTVECVWHEYDAATRTADVHVIGFYGLTTIGVGHALTTLDIEFPAGGFTETGS